MRRVRRHLVVAVVLAAALTACGDDGSQDDGPQSVAVQMESEDGSCGGAATFEVPAGWRAGEDHHLVEPDKVIDVYVSCRSRAVFDELGYTGPWTLEDVDDWFAAGSPTGPTEAVVDGHPARLRDRSVQLATLLHVTVLSTIVDDTFVVFTADVNDDRTYAEVEDELVEVLTGARLSVD